MSNTIWRVITAAVVLGLVFPAHAHDPEPKHGGRIVHAGSYHIELVTKGTSIAAFLLAHDEKPLPSRGYQGVAILVVDGKSERVPLAAADDNQLRGTSPLPVPDNPKGVVQITSPTGVTSQAKFN
ncbi:hypothetical protein [Rhodoplanes roseus]|uniref:Uncharacterized protein n=1 Tax=Rhodoplanes roseus TaxID=29409 RepID=A0A327L356_9BRAD|nr:hypothetical protein [Rhodoplanes roseus]RAI44817.1 hypothetical protein CH341_07275 [Rhodoplanes roseus]